MGSEYPAERKRILDNMFELIELGAKGKGTYAFLCDVRYDYSRWSKTAVETFDLPDVYMIHAGQIWGKYVHKDDQEGYYDGLNNIFNGNDIKEEYSYRAKKPNGEYVYITCAGKVMRDENGEPEYFGGTIRNHGAITYVDDITGLRNQYGFFEDVSNHIRRKEFFKITMIGIGKFSEINEVYGYHFGNRILQFFGKYLKDSIKTKATLYRMDGTRFAILGTEWSSDRVEEAYSVTREYFRSGITIDDKYVVLDTNASLIKVDKFDVNDQVVYACLNFAYGESKFKKQGELVEFYNDLNENNKLRLEKLHAIKNSITQNFKGFFLCYQPVVDAHTENLSGAEALLRWKSEEYGFVPPDHFIPILEKDPIFPHLGRWILKTAVEGVKPLLSRYPAFVINVNLSYSQLERPDFIFMVDSVLEETGFPARNLCLEITERCRLLDLTMLKNIVAALRMRGIKVALDDFGTGFSSVGILKQLPIDIIKVDRSIVMRIEEDEKEKELVKHFTGMAATFGAKVCVEGIETSGMRDILQEYTVASFQGYYYSKPLELEAFNEWVNK
ncbi:MAG: EAL domain-containing protein [Lachnospiraceae bacterium]|nr:EAL domain-containing protein [Lachnospiraceae bacterium]